MAQGRALGAVARHHRHIDVTGAVLFVADVAFRFEKPQQGADGRIARRLRQPGLDLGGSGAAPGEEDVEDLPLASADVEVCGTFGTG
mgnify:CR=1 FL=1